MSLTFTPNIAMVGALPSALPKQLGGTVDAFFGNPQALVLEVLPDPGADAGFRLAYFTEAMGVWAFHEVAEVSAPHTQTSPVPQRYVCLGVPAYYVPVITSGAGLPTACIEASREGGED